MTILTQLMDLVRLTLSFWAINEKPEVVQAHTKGMVLVLECEKKQMFEFINRRLHIISKVLSIDS